MNAARPRPGSLPPELRRHLRWAVGASALLAATGVAALALAFVERSEGPAPWVLVLFSLVALGLSGFGLLIAPRWYRRAVRIVASVPPLPASATFVLDEDSDSTELRASVVVPGEPIRRALRVPLLVPAAGSPLETAGEHAVELWVDPETARIVALGTEEGVHWCVPPGRPLEVGVRHGTDGGGRAP